MAIDAASPVSSFATISTEVWRTSSAAQNYLTLLDPMTREYMKVAKLFYKGWRHPRKRARSIVRILRVVHNQQSMEEFDRYLDFVQDQLLSSKKALPATRIESLLFHGTTRACELGNLEGVAEMCTSDECSLCRIVLSSFDVTKCGSKHTFSRFGTGIYSTSCSSKADDYSVNVSGDKEMKALVLSRVVVGRSATLRKNVISAERPPCGYHSIFGEPGEDLNYEETVVYRNEAIRPAYIVMYAKHTSPLVSSGIKASVRTWFRPTKP